MNEPTKPPVVAPVAGKPPALTPPAPLRVKLLDTANLLTSTRTTVLYMGPEGSGKSHCVMSWPRPMLILHYDPNLATTMKFLDDEVVVFDAPDTRLLQTQIMPSIRSRQLAKLIPDRPDLHDVINRVQTIALDSASFLAIQCMNDIMGNSEARPEFDQRSVFLKRMRDWLNTLIAARRPQGDHPGYNIVATCHERIYTDDKGNTNEIGPKIEGQFRNELCSLFEVVLYNHTKRTMVQVDNRTEAKVAYQCYTVPPDGFRRAKDAMGGGRFKRLPYTVEGTYPSLAAAWGINNTKESK